MCREKKNGRKDASFGIDVGEEHWHFLARITLDNLATQAEQGRRVGRKKKKDKTRADLESKSMWVSSRRFVMNDIKGQVNGLDVPCSQYIQGT
jgi:hypothetical protein